MNEPSNRLGDRGDGRTIRNNRSLEQEHWNAEQSRRGDLAVRRFATAVLGNHCVKGERLKQRPVLLFGKRTAPQNVMYVRHIERRLDRIHTSDDVEVLGSFSEGTELLAPDSEKHSPGLSSQCTDCILRIGHVDPIVAADRGPRWTTQSQQGRVCPPCRTDSVRRNCIRVRMSGINEKINLVDAEILSEPLSPTKSTSPHANRLCGGRSGPTGKRHRDNEIVTSQCEAQLSCLGSTSENQYVRAHG